MTFAELVIALFDDHGGRKSLNSLMLNPSRRSRDKGSRTIQGWRHVTLCFCSSALGGPERPP
jgi:hypothetical protein